MGSIDTPRFACRAKNPAMAPRPSSTPPADEPPNATMESTRLCHLQKCRSDPSVARGTIYSLPATLHLRLGDVEDAATDRIGEDSVVVVRHQAIKEVHTTNRCFLRVLVHHTTRVRHDSQLTSWERSTLRLHSVRQSATQCVRIGENKNCIGAILSLECLSH